MALLNVRCPECRALLKAKIDFIVGEKVTCPKCETPFTVKAPEGDALTGTSALTGATTKKTQAESEFLVGSRQHSLLWYAAFTVLIAGIVALGFIIAQKLPDKPEVANTDTRAKELPPPDLKQPNAKQPNPKQKGKQPNPKQKPPDGKQEIKQPNPKQPAGPLAGVGPFGGLFGGSGGVVPPGEKDKLLQKYKAALVGNWKADLGGGLTEELTYTADGAYTAKLSGPTPVMDSGKYTVKEVVGTKTLKIQLDTAAGARTVTAVFDDDELQHPSLQKGITAVFRKK